MGRRKKIEVPITKFQLAELLMAEIKNMEEFSEADLNEVSIVAPSKIVSTIHNLDNITKRLGNYIHINGNKRVNKKELCKILRISRPTLDKWERDKLVVMDFTCGSKTLLLKYLSLNITNLDPFRIIIVPCKWCDNNPDRKDPKEPEEMKAIFNTCFPDTVRSYNLRWLSCPLVDSVNEKSKYAERVATNSHRSNFGVDLTAFHEQLTRLQNNFTNVDGNFLFRM